MTPALLPRKQHHGPRALRKDLDKPTDEKRMVVIQPETDYGDWISATPGHSMNFMQPHQADRLVALAAPER